MSPFPWTSTTAPSLGATLPTTRSCSHGRSHGPTLQETTIGFAAEAVAPSTLDEVWIKRSDFPTLIDQEVTGTTEAGGFDLDLAKYFIATHINHPRIENSQAENFGGMIIRRLTKLRKEYDPLGYGGLVDPDMVTGSPRSVLAIARAIARGDGNDKVSEERVRHSLSGVRQIHARVPLRSLE